MRVANELASAVEEAEVLDGAAERIGGLAGRLVGQGRVRDLLSGTPLGHPAHPAVVMVPLGMWSSAAVAGLAGEDRAARRLTGLGLAAALPAVATGLSDWVDTAGAERRVGLVHVAANTVGFGLFAASWRARVAGRSGAGTALALVGTVFTGLGGWLGGHLAYGLGVGVDTNSFQGGPTDWTPIEGVDQAPAEGELSAGRVDGIGVVVSSQAGKATALANRCSHRGGPLAEGEVRDGCVRCPWHGSEFDLTTGGVAKGPAVVPQPVYEVRSAAAGLEGRRKESRALRTNSARP